ncbi:hypothetical protein ABZS78_39490, partial [Streptomyces decoyicus]
GTVEEKNPFDKLWTDVEYAGHLKDLAAQGKLGDSYSWDRVNSSLALVAWLERLDRRSGALGAPVPVTAGS